MFCIACCTIAGIILESVTIFASSIVIVLTEADTNNRAVQSSWAVVDVAVVVQSRYPVRLFVTPWTAACQASLSITNSQNLLKLMFIESVMPSNHLILCRPLLLLPSIFPSIKVFSKESALRIRWPKCWSFSFPIIPSSEYSGLSSFRTGWLDLLAIQALSRVFEEYKLTKPTCCQPLSSASVIYAHHGFALHW